MAKKSVAGTKDDPTIQFATLTVGDNAYKLAFSFNAIAEAESKAGCNLLMGLTRFEYMTAQQLRGLLYAALSVAHPEITVAEAGMMVTLETITPIMQALGQAYVLSLPEEKKSEPEPEPEPS